MTTLGGMRIPPGRAGRLWLERRLATAQHAGKLLKEKVAILNREEQRLAKHAAEAAAEWQRLCAELETWTLRAAALSGRRALRIASAGTTAQAEVVMGSTIGIQYPLSGEVYLERQEDLVAVGSAAVPQASAAAHSAVQAALSAALQAAALRAIRAELAATRRTLRAVEQRWIPQLSTRLAEVRLELEESEQAEGVRHRWAAQHVIAPRSPLSTHGKT
jgi:V/A-type H+-transporting ATPase subunit D